MRWCLAILFVVFALPLLAQEDEAAKLFQNFEKKLTEAKAYRVTFQVDSELRTKPYKVKGELLVAGNKLKATMEGKEDNTNTMKIFLSDGKNFDFTWRRLDIGKGVGFPGKPMPGLGKTVTWISARMGMQFNFSYLEGPAAGMGGEVLLFSDKIKLTGFKLAGKEKIRDKETNLVTFDLNMPNEKSRIPCKLWLDAKTNMPLKRSLEFTAKDKITRTGVETYSRWEIDPKIEEGTFALPK